MNTKNSLKSTKTQWALVDIIMGKGLAPPVYYAFIVNFLSLISIVQKLFFIILLIQDKVKYATFRHLFLFSRHQAYRLHMKRVNTKYVLLTCVYVGTYTLNYLTIA